MENKEKEQLLYKSRHTMAHVLAAAVKSIFGDDVKFGIGPAIDNGFYYDFDMEHNLTPEDFEKIEDKMREIISQNLDMTKTVLSKERALEMFKEQPYKVELINDLQEGSEISIYSLGDLFVDLCKGPHVENTKYLRGFAFKINRVSGAYWHGSEKNKMMQRIYVYGFLEKQELKDYLKMLEEAEKRDHRKLGKELGLFFISDYAPGMPFYMPKGVIIKNELIKYWREVHSHAGYLEIETPMAMNRKLWEISGHWDHYQNNMYTFKVEDDDFAIKPMNCPGGLIYYKEGLHSYKDLPLRVAELGKVHRQEASGTLHGLFRVRCFTQDDAHIFLKADQLEQEVKNILSLVDEMYGTFGLTYHLELSTMPESHIGEISDWEFAENSLKSALEHIGKEYVINEGDGAFYGPKIDIHIKDAIGRTWQCGTIQLDMQLPKRFGIDYVDEDGERKEPLMLHRVIYGSIDRFLGIITENYAGAFPTWLSPVQVEIIPISEKFLSQCENIESTLKSVNIRAELDKRNEKLGYKLRGAISQKVPYVIIIGENEIQKDVISVRKRGQNNTIEFKLEDFKTLLLNEINNRR